jgi:hypothetical protein
MGHAIFATRLKDARSGIRSFLPRGSEMYQVFYYKARRGKVARSFFAPKAKRHVAISAKQVQMRRHESSK